MFKLILHHVYRSSAPFIDISGHGNHAQGPNVGWNEDGAAQQSGAAVFNGASSRSLVPLNPVWQDLTALRVETLLRFEPVQGTPGKPARLRRHLVVEGPLSFAVFIGKEKNAVGMVMGLLKDPDADDDLSANDTLTATLTSGGSVDPFTTLVADLPQPLPIPPGYKLDWVPVASTPEFAPDGQNRTIEPGEWTRIEFAHTGTSLWLYLDGVLAGVRHDMISPVLPVQGTGVHIGWAPGAFPDTLRGRLDELRIWKYDPYCHTKKFFCRPMTPETESCWRLLLGRLQALATKPETGTQLTAVLECLDAALISLLRALLQRGQPAMDEARRFARRYDDLWCRGAIEGAAMRTLTGEFMSWLEQTAGDSWSEYLSQALKCITKLKGLDFGPKIGDLGSCDPAFVEFLAGINRQVASDLLSCFARSDSERRRKRVPSTRERDLYKPISNDA